MIVRTIIFVALLLTSPAFSQEVCTEWQKPAPVVQESEVGTATTEPPSQPKFHPIEHGGSRPGLVFLGDSLTRDNNAHFPRIAAQSIGRSLSVYAIGGERAEVLAELFDQVELAPDAIGIIWIGRNNAPDDPQILQSIETAAAHFESDRFLVLSFLSGRYRSEQPGAHRRELIDQLNETLRNRFSDRFIVTRSLVSCSDYRDNIHLQASGYEKIGLSVAQAIDRLGW